MTIHYAFKDEDNLLFVEASGFDESLEEVQQYGMAVIQACREGKYSRVLCNEISLEYRLSTVDTFKSAEYLAAYAPGLGKAAIVCNEKSFPDGYFWETVAVNRGLTVRFFKDVESARKWLE